MLKKLFGRKEKPTEETIVAPLNGKMIEIEQVPDPTFSEKMMGDGIAIQPTEGKVVSPVDGEIIQFFHTKHAIGIRSKTGLELLLHIGLETVNLEGEGFEGHVKQGGKVKKGDPLLTFDLDFVKEKAASTISPVVITNGDIVETVEKTRGTTASKGETNIMQVKVKE
jgi:PTS system glucose-specific IIA component